jgi:hypothetical protein
MDMKNSIHLNIDAIVLRGMEQIDRQALTEGLRNVVTRQLAGMETISAASSPRIKTSITLPLHSNSHRLGERLGRSLADILTSGECNGNFQDNNQKGGRHDG